MKVKPKCSTLRPARRPAFDRALNHPSPGNATSFLKAGASRISSDSLAPTTGTSATTEASRFGSPPLHATNRLATSTTSRVNGTPMAIVDPTMTSATETVIISALNDAPPRMPLRMNMYKGHVA